MKKKIILRYIIIIKYYNVNNITIYYIKIKKKKKM